MNVIPHPEEFESLVRSTREDVASIEHALSNGLSVDRGKAGQVVGIVKGLKALGFYLCVDTYGIEKWLCASEDWKQK